jgi:outer membrane protein TolC
MIRGVRMTLGAALVAVLLGSPLMAQQPAPSVLGAAARTPAGDTLALTLADAVRRAVDESEEVRLARLQSDVVNASIRNELSSSLPQVNGSLGYTRNIKSQFDTGSEAPTEPVQLFKPDSLAPLAQRISYLEKNAPLAIVDALSGGNLFGDLPFGRKNSFTWNLNASQELGLTSRTKLKRIPLYREAAQLQIDEQVADVELQVRTAYYRAQFATELSRIAQAAVAQAEAFLKQEELREESGSSAELDVMRAQVASANLRTQLVQATNAAELAMLDLHRLVNIPANQPVALTSPLAMPSQVLLTAAMAESAETTAERAAIGAAERNVRIKELDVKIARGEFLPSGAIRFNYGRSLYPSSLFGWGGDSWRTDFSASLSVNVPIFDGFRKSSLLQLARVSQTQAELQLTQLREGIDLQYEQAAGERRRAATAITAQQQTVNQAQRVYDLTVLRYDRGLATQLEVSDSRLMLLQASTNLAQALSDFYIAEATVQRALGRSVTP